MAKKIEEKIEQEEEKNELIKVKAKTCLKYNSKYVEIGQELEIYKKDLKIFLDRNLIEKLSR